MSWLIVTGFRLIASGTVRARIIPRTTTSVLPRSTSLKLVFWTAVSETWSWLSERKSVFISLGETQGTPPCQKTATDLGGVAPLTKDASEPRGLQPASLGHVSGRPRMRAKRTGRARGPPSRRPLLEVRGVGWLDRGSRRCGVVQTLAPSEHSSLSGIGSVCCSRAMESAGLRNSSTRTVVRSLRPVRVPSLRRLR